MSFVSASAPPTFTPLRNLSLRLHRRSPDRPSLLFSFGFSNPRPDTAGLLLCRASKSQGNPVKKRQQPSGAGKRKKKPKDARDVEIVDDFVIGEGEDEGEGEGEGERASLSVNSAGYHPTPLPKPPAGFVVDDQGRVVMASDKRLVTIVDPTNNFPLECVIRRIFRSSGGDECMLLCPADTPVQILKSTNIDGWSAVNDEEVDSILPTAAYALAKIHMHLVYSGFCYTARGGFCYSEDDIFDFRTDDGQDVEGLPTEGVEITCFHMDGAHYMIYTPSDPLLFVAVKVAGCPLAELEKILNARVNHDMSNWILFLQDQNGQLQIADDDLLEDPCIISAIDEETEFNALVEEEAALLESLMGER